MSDPLFDWRRFWCPRGGTIVLNGGGFLLDPESEYGPHYNPHVVAFEQIATRPCLVLLGEPGIGKTTALERHRAETEAAVRQAGEDLLWRNLNAYQSDVLLVRSIFEAGRVVEDRVGAARVAQVDPHPSLSGGVPAWVQDRHRSIIGVDHLRRQHPLGQELVQR